MTEATEKSRHESIQEFIQELNGFAHTAETTLSEIESAMEEKKGLFSVFAEQMFTIRGTSQQLEFPQIAFIAGLGEEIAVKAQTASTRPQIRKCIGALWDALTTVKYMLVHYDTRETNEEQQILINRLEATLKALGGARPTIDEDEIAKLLGQRS